MTVDIPTRAPEHAPSDDRRGRGGRASKPGRLRDVGKAPLVVGGQPRANLLPPEIILKRKQLKTRRALRAGVLLVAIAVAAGCVGSFAIASVSQVQLTLAQQAQANLVAEQGQYIEVKQVQDTIVTIVAGQEVGGSTEIAWRDYLTDLQATLPDGVTLQTVSIESGTPMAVFGQSEAPLQGERVAGLTFTAFSPTLPSIPDWLRSLADLTGFVDAVPGSVRQEGGGYTAEVLMHINAEAFSMRFDPEHVASALAQAEKDAAAAAAGESSVSKSLVAATNPADPADTTDDATDGVTDGAADGPTTDGEGN